MTTLLLILAIIVLLSSAIAVYCELHRDLMMLQQNSYRYERYLRWLRASGDTTSLLRLSGMAAFLISLSRFSRTEIGMVLILIVALCVILKAMMTKYKKPLVMTSRALRIFLVSIALSVAVAVIAVVSFSDLKSLESIATVASVAMIGCYCASHIIIVVANAILAPVQAMINRHYYNDARQRLTDMPDLKIVAVTGSYGKTSTKHFLFEILSEHFDTLMTPGNFNTTLGVVRTIRENLKPYNQVFIVEMGAKQKGDIEDICKLVHPQIGIVTAVGPMHLETFGSIERVRDTKFELVDSLPADGLAVLNNDFTYIASREVSNVPAVRYSLNPYNKEARFIATDIEYSASGTTFTVVDRQTSESLTLTTSLVGSCNISNLVAAVIVALHLGVPKEKIKYAVSRISQVEHRLKISTTGAGYTLIDDAYNSNPVGSAMALEVLASFTSGRRFIITPGMVELGDDQYKLNHDFGAKIPGAADVAIIVGQCNNKAIVEGIKSSPKQAACQVIEAGTFNEAHAKFLSMMKHGDTLLLENDLPDTFK